MASEILEVLRVGLDRIKIGILAAGLIVLVSLAFFESSSGQSSPTGLGNCVKLDVAKELASKYLENKFCQTPFSDEDDRQLCSDARTRLGAIWFNSEMKSWVATLWEGYCAPAAQCWSGVFVDCEGRVTEFQDGED